MSDPVETPDTPTSQSAETPKPNLKVVGGADTSATDSRPNWLSKLIRVSGPKSKPIKHHSNGMIALREAPELRSMLTYDASALIVIVNRSPPWEDKRLQREHEIAVREWRADGKTDTPRPELVRPNRFEPRKWSDQDDRLFAEWLHERGILSSLRDAREAAVGVAFEYGFHPIKDYLNNLQWDGKPRIDKWLHHYLGTPDDAYHTMIGRKWLVSGVARILGLPEETKADCMLILQGKQGLGKSTALWALVPDRRWFLDEARDMSSKDALMCLQGKWIVEFAELESFKGVSAEKLKAFLSRTTDNFRPPYGRDVINCPRQFIFAGTTNKNEIFSDSTGNRRFWPAECTKIEDLWLIEDRDQLWAEAKAAYMRGDVWWVDTAAEKKLADDATATRFVGDVLEPEVEMFLKSKAFITLRELALNVFDMDSATKIARSDQTRLRDILQHLGWKAKTTRVGEKVIWAYHPPEPPPAKPGVSLT